MNCDRARAKMLTAHPAELGGDRDGDLAGHLRECGACRARAELLLAAQRELHAAIVSEAGADEAPPVHALVMAVERRRRNARRAWRWTPLAAAAAGFAGLLLMRGNPAPEGRAFPPAPRVEAAHGVTVTAPPGRNVAVLQSQRSDIVVIWFF